MKTSYYIFKTTRDAFTAKIEGMHLYYNCDKKDSFYYSLFSANISSKTYDVIGMGKRHAATILRGWEKYDRGNEESAGDRRRKTCNGYSYDTCNYEVISAGDLLKYYGISVREEMENGRIERI